MPGGTSIPRTRSSSVSSIHPTTASLMGQGLEAISSEGATTLMHSTPCACGVVCVRVCTCVVHACVPASEGAHVCVSLCVHLPTPTGRCLHPPPHQHAPGMGLHQPRAMHRTWACTNTDHAPDMGVHPNTPTVGAFSAASSRSSRMGLPLMVTSRMAMPAPGTAGGGRGGQGGRWEGGMMD